jgi:uncharacterized protein (DUF111 family)
MLAYVQEKLLAAGRDAWFTQVQMKKGRPHHDLGDLRGGGRGEDRTAPPAETSTLGVRVRPVHRWEANARCSSSSRRWVQPPSR